MKYGYARVSSQDQNLARQLQRLKEVGMDRIYEEKYLEQSMNVRN